MTKGAGEMPSIRVLGTRVHMLEIPEVVGVMDRWIETDPSSCHHIVNSGMHGLMEAHRDPKLKSILNQVDLFAPDGILIILVARLRGFSLKKKNTGPDLLWEFSSVANVKGYNYYLYGDEEETLGLLSSKLETAFPSLQLVGRHSPPFRELTMAEDEADIQAINDAGPEVLWVALGMPKQEVWIAEHRERLQVPIVIGAGASLKFASGSVRRAPSWLRNSGFEWLWRLASEPRRVWRRVCLDAPQFVGMVALELSGLRKFN